MKTLLIYCFVGLYALVSYQLLKLSPWSLLDTLIVVSILVVLFLSGGFLSSKYERLPAPLGEILM